MPRAALPENETARLRALDDYEILDTPTEPEFDAVTSLASAICGTPISVVNFIANGRQWFKSEVGLGVRETPLEPSICAHAILQSNLFVVPDVTQDARFADNPLVLGEPYIRFYAGTLLTSHDGYPLGTLCVLDTKPRALNPHQVSALRTLGQHVQNMLDLRRTNRQHEALIRRLNEVLNGRQRMVATIAHDLRTPLSVIELGSEMMASPDTDPAATRSIAGRLHRAAGSMKRLVEDLLDVESQGGGALSVELEPMRIRPLIEEMVELMTPLAANVQVRLRLDEIPDARIMGDSGRLHQVLGNLVGNALKFTPAHGQVTVSADTDGGMLWVRVADTGIGIAAEDISAIFDPYVRIRSMNSHGAGLGLAIARRIVEAHSGQIGVKSVIGSGSSFWFKLPILTD